MTPVRPPRIFYGWWIVAASVPIALYTAGSVFYGFTAIFQPIADELGWSYTQISLASSLRGLEMGLLAPLIGILIDRYGPRRLMIVGCLVAASGLFLLSRTHSLATFYGAFVLISIGMSTSAMTTITSSVANWFHGRVGIATGIAISGFGLGGLMIPVVVQLVEVFDWRTTVSILAVGLVVVIAPLSLVFRHRPEQYGYLPDGAIPVASHPLIDGTPIVTVTDNEPRISVRQALKSRPFLAMAVSFTAQILVVSSVITHVMPYLTNIGLSRTTAGLIATAIPVSSIVGRIGFGIISDRLNRWGITAVGFGLLTVGLICFSLIESVGLWVVVPFVAFFAIGYGGLNVMRASLLRSYFGRRTFGTLFGILMGVNLIGAFLGPPLAALMYDRTLRAGGAGTYGDTWLFFAIAPLVPMVISLVMLRTSRTVKSPGYHEEPG